MISDASNMEQRCWSTLPSHLLNLIFDTLPDAHDVASAQATCRAWDQHQRRTTISLAVEGGQRFAASDVDAFAAHWRRRAATVKHAAAVLRSQPSPSPSLHLDVQVSCSKLGVPMSPSSGAAHPEARGAARQLLLALPPTVIRLQLSEVFSTLPELGKTLEQLKHLRHLHLEISPASLAELSRSDSLCRLHTLQSLTFSSPMPLSATSGLCLKETFSIAIPPSLQTLSLTNVPIGSTLAASLLASSPCLMELALDGCHADLRAAPFPWPALQRLSARRATLGASHSQLVALSSSARIVHVDLNDARLYDHAACGVEYLSFTFKRWDWITPCLQSLDLQLHCQGGSAPWATFCNGPLGELFGRCYTPLAPQSTVTLPPTTTTAAVGVAAVGSQPCTFVHYRGTLTQLAASGMATHPGLRALTLRVGASHVPGLLATLPALHEAHFSADPGDVHLRLQLPRSCLKCLSLEGFVLDHADLRSCLQLTSLRLAVPHTQHLHRACSEGGASTSSSDGADSTSDDESSPRRVEQPTVLLPPGLTTLVLGGRVPTLVSEVPVGGAGSHGEVDWDLRGLRSLRTLSLRDGGRTLSACVRLPYTLRSLAVGDVWAPRALQAWAPRLQNLRELRLSNLTECPQSLREALAQLPSLRRLCWATV